MLILNEGIPTLNGHINSLTVNHLPRIKIHIAVIARHKIFGEGIKLITVIYVFTCSGNKILKNNLTYPLIGIDVCEN